MTVRKSGEVVIPGVTPAQVQPVVDAALHSLSGARRTRAWDGFCEVKTGFTFGSYGEIVGASISEVPGGTRVEVRSESSFPLTLIDYGKCSRNVERVTSSALAGRVTA